jgi:hypothetical protein
MHVAKTLPRPAHGRVHMQSSLMGACSLTRLFETTLSLRYQRANCDPAVTKTAYHSGIESSGKHTSACCDRRCH